MRNTPRKFLMGLGLAICLALPPGPAAAVGFEDSLDDCNYPETFDLLVMRPLSFSALVVGSAVWVPAFGLALLATPGDLGAVSENLVYSPARFTFRRPLGECSGVTLQY